MKNYFQNVPNLKKTDLSNKKKNILLYDIPNDCKKKLNLDNINSNKEKDQQKPDKDRSPIFQQIFDSNEEDKKIINILNPNNNILNDNYMNEKIINDSNDIKNKIINQKSKLEIKSNISNNYDNNNDTNQKNPESINIFINEKNKEFKIDNIKHASTFKNHINPIKYDENISIKIEENDKKLKKSLQAYKNLNQKNDYTSLNTLYKLRSILLNLLKDKEQDLEYSKFITEKKLKYLMKNKEKAENRIKTIESELNTVELRREELEKDLGEIYIFYDEEELKEDIKRFENSNEVKSGKFSKTLEQLETMKKMLPLVSEYSNIKAKKNKLTNERKECEKIIKNSSQTIAHLNNYYKNIKKKINE
jgi:hypothetical protein